MADSRADRAVLEAQFAYFAYRTLDCLPALLTGSSRNAALLDARSKWLARSLHLLLQHGDQLPEPEQVLPATEALTSLLFHACHCDRSSYVRHLRHAYDQVFVRCASLDTLPPASLAMRAGFERALADYPDDLAGEAAPRDTAGAVVRAQIRELAGVLRRELAERALAMQPTTDVA